DNKVLPYQRGVWVRLYGISLHAWSVDFFKLCVLDCGRFLRADSCSTDKDRLDFARVLIATSDLEIVKRVETVLVDGILVEIKIVEEWGYAIGEDTCLFEDENDSEASQSDNEAVPGDPDVRCNVDMLVDKLADGLDEEDCIEVQEKIVEQLSNQ
ncbi:sulfate transporter, partial [Trifolium medium]|nr:sulfate transporter [Trifolium medium]